MFSSATSTGRRPTSRRRSALVRAAGLLVAAMVALLLPRSAMAGPPAVVYQLEAMARSPLRFRVVRPVAVYSLPTEQLEGLAIAAPPVWSLDLSGPRLALQPDLMGRWRAGTRDDDLRVAAPQAKRVRRFAAGVAMTGGLSVLAGGLLKGGRRSGAGAQAPIVDAGSHTGAELGVVVGSGVLLTSAVMASLPLEGGLRRLRPTPIGGRRWGGAALRWRF